MYIDKYKMEEVNTDEISLTSDYTVVAPDTDSLFFRPPTLEDLDAIFTLEIASYPEDEAATREKLKACKFSCACESLCSALC